MTLLARLDAARRERGAALLGVVNVTPDSFYDGGRFDDPAAARDQVEAVIAAGADLVDLGAESTRPGAVPVPTAEQRRRLEPALTAALADHRALVSIDTADPDVAGWALERGAHVINDVSCLAHEELARVVARRQAAIVIMHARGPMSAMRGFSDYPDAGYADVVADVMREWSLARDRAIAAGVAREHVLFDPGLGFAKNARQSLELLRRTRELAALGARLVLGPSRKSFISSLDPSTPAERLGGTLAACLVAVQGGAHVLRVHDVREVRQALLVARATSPLPEVA